MKQSMLISAVLAILLAGVAESSAQEMTTLQKLSSKVLKAKVTLQSKKQKVEGYIYDYTADTVVVSPEKERIGRLLSSNCSDCLRIPVDEIDKVFFSRLDGLGQLSLVLGYIGVGIVLYNAITNPDAEEDRGAFLFGVTYGPPLLISLLVSQGTALTRIDSRTVNAKELADRDLDDLHEFAIKNQANYTFKNNIRYLNFLKDRLARDPHKRLDLLRFYHSSGSISIGYVTSIEDNHIYITSSYDDVIEQRLGRTPRNTSLDFSDIIWIDLAPD